MMQLQLQFWDTNRHNGLVQTLTLLGGQLTVRYKLVFSGASFVQETQPFIWTPPEVHKLPSARLAYCFAGAEELRTAILGPEILQDSASHLKTRECDRSRNKRIDHAMIVSLAKQKRAGLDARLYIR